MTATPQQQEAPAIWLPRLAIAVPAGVAAGAALVFAPPAVAAAAFIAPALAASWIDVRTRRIPNAITGGGVAAALAFGLGSGMLPSALAGLGVVGGIGLVLYLAWRGGFGLGDVKLLAYAGAVTGVGGVPILLVAMAGSGAVLALGALIRYRDRRATIPYGPAITIGLIAAVLANL